MRRSTQVIAYVRKRALQKHVQAMNTARNIMTVLVRALSDAGVTSARTTSCSTTTSATSTAMSHYSSSLNNTTPSQLHAKMKNQITQEQVDTCSAMACLRSLGHQRRS